jgi:transposase
VDANTARERSFAAAEQLLRTNASVRAQVARRRIARLRELDRDIRDLADQLTKLVAVSRTRLVELVGTAPIPVDSGRTDRHRLNRGGNRRLNRALHYMALTQVTWEPRAVAYLTRRLAEGKTRREALRCLKRRLSNVVFNALAAGPKPPTTRDDATAELAA